MQPKSEIAGVSLTKINDKAAITIKNIQFIRFEKKDFMKKEPFKQESQEAKIPLPYVLALIAFSAMILVQILN